MCPQGVGGSAPDLGWNDLGYQRGALPGQQNAIDSPHLDALALAGVRLFDYAVFKFCSPSRSQRPPPTAIRTRTRDRSRGP